MPIPNLPDIRRFTDNPSDLVKDIRRFWFNNEPGTFQLGNRSVIRREIQIYGGPAPQFNPCNICQRSEWLSRLEQKNLFQSHSCSTSERCRWLCSVQGNELWTLYHQNFWFMVGCNPSLQAPRVALFYDKGQGSAFWYTRFWSDNCDHAMIDWRRAMAQACQVDVLENLDEVDWSKYDFAYVKVRMDPINRPPIPVIAWGEDYFRADYVQNILNWLQPNILITPYPTAWSQFELDGEVQFQPHAASQFFTRSNLGPKDLDLLVIGGMGHGIYNPRRRLDEQIKALTSGYQIRFNHHQTLHQKHPGPTRFMHGNEEVHYLNEWSKYLGSAKFVTFGAIDPPCHEKVVAKYGECLGSGAIPILPEPADLTKHFGVEPMTHYIPQRNILGNNDQLRYYLDHYADFRYIAENAVRWHKENIDHLLFDGFEDIIQKLTEGKYSRRLSQ